MILQQEKTDNYEQLLITQSIKGGCMTMEYITRAQFLGCAQKQQGKKTQSKSSFVEIVLLRFVCLFKDFIYLFLERREGREKKGEKHQCMVASCASLLGTCPVTQACALTGNQTHDPSVHRLVLNPLGHTNQGKICFFLKKKNCNQFHKPGKHLQSLYPFYVIC